MTAKTPLGSEQEPRQRLERQYGNIGISAVAAAVRYYGDRHPAYAPAEPQDEEAPPRQLSDAA